MRIIGFLVIAVAGLLLGIPAIFRIHVAWGTDSPGEPAMRWRASAGTGFALQSYSLDSSSAYNIRVPLRGGLLLSAGLRRELSESLAASLALERAAFSYPEISGLSSAPLAWNELELRAGSEIGIHGGISLRPAWYWRKRSVDEVRPIAVLTGSVSHGPLLEAAYRVPVDGSIMSEVGVRLFLPIYYREEFQPSGYARSRVRFGIHYRGRYRLNDRLAASFLPEFRFEQNTFGGTGARTLSEVRERWVTAAFPLRLEGEF